MPTPASQAALEGLRDLSTLQWYVIPLLAIVFYIYTAEIKKARQSGQLECGFRRFDGLWDECFRVWDHGLDLLVHGGWFIENSRRGFSSCLIQIDV